MSDQDLIGRLIDIEHQAASLLFDAQTEADKRLAQVRLDADANFKTEYEKIIAHEEKKYHEQKNQIDTDYQEKINAYYDSVRSLPLDKKAGTLLLDSLFFAGN
ncbi:MAG: hypothetical protein ACRC4W_03530 [Treponemataceae bacterium]